MFFKMNVNLQTEFAEYPEYLIPIAKKIIDEIIQNKPHSVIQNKVEQEINALIAEKGGK